MWKKIPKEHNESLPAIAWFKNKYGRVVLGHFCLRGSKYVEILTMDFAELPDFTYYHELLPVNKLNWQLVKFDTETSEFVWIKLESEKEILAIRSEWSSIDSNGTEETGIAWLDVSFDLVGKYVMYYQPLVKPKI